MSGYIIPISTIAKYAPHDRVAQERQHRNMRNVMGGAAAASAGVAGGSAAYNYRRGKAKLPVSTKAIKARNAGYVGAAGMAGGAAVNHLLASGARYKGRQEKARDQIKYLAVRNHLLSRGYQARPTSPVSKLRDPGEGTGERASRYGRNAGIGGAALGAGTVWNTLYKIPGVPRPRMENEMRLGRGGARAVLGGTGAAVGLEGLRRGIRRSRRQKEWNEFRANGAH